LVFLVVFTAAVLAIAQTAHAHGDDQSHGGSNQQSFDNHGSVKVDDDVVDDLPANHPHVICALRIVVEHGFGAPFDIDFDADAPTTRAGNDQRLLIVHVPNGDNISGLIDLRAFVAGILPGAQGFHIFITVHLPGGDKHKVIWVLKDCPSSTSSTVKSGGTTTTTIKHHGTTTTTTTVKGTTSTTATTLAGGAVPNATATTSTVPTEVLGENFTKSPAAAATDATSLATTGLPFPPALAVGLIGFGLLALGGARHVSGRRLELSMRRVNDENQQRFKL
jgi:hypothetical protein